MVIACSCIEGRAAIPVMVENVGGVGGRRVRGEHSLDGSAGGAPRGRESFVRDCVLNAESEVILHVGVTRG